MVVELARVEVDIPIAEASDEVPTATITIKLLFIVALDCGMFSSIFVFITSIFNLVKGIPDGTGELFGAAIAATLEQNLIQIDGSLLSEWYMSVQHACFEALVDFIGIYASISEELVHRLLPSRLLSLATFLLRGLTRPSIDDAGHELIFGARLGEVRIRAHLLHLSNIEIPQRLVVGLEPPDEA